SLALAYLQETNLFDTVVNTFSEIIVHSSADDDARTLLDYDAHIAGVLNIIEEIRSCIRTASKQGKIIFGPQRSGREEIKAGPSSPTLHLLLNLCGADAVVFDDRALNKEPFAQDQKNHRVPCLTS